MKINFNNTSNTLSTPKFKGAVLVKVLREGYISKTSIAKEHVLANNLLNKKDTLMIDLPNLDRVLFVDGKERKILQAFHDNEQNALKGYFSRYMVGDAVKEVRKEIKYLKSKERKVALRELHEIEKTGSEALNLDRNEFSFINPDGKISEFNRKTPIQRKVLEKYLALDSEAKEILLYARQDLNRAAKDVINNPNTIKIDIH